MIQEINIEKLCQGYNPRKNVGDLDSLKTSIQDIGLLNPLLVRPVNGNYEIIAGHRRYLAAKEIGKESLSCMVRDISDTEAFHLAFVDNKERNNLNALEEAEHYRECQGKGMTVREIASKYGFKGPASISERLSLCSLPEQIHQLLFGHPNRISPNHAYEISKLCKPDELKKLFEDNQECFDDWMQAYNDELKYRQDQQIKLANAVIDSDLSVKSLSSKVKDLKKELNDRDKHITDIIEKEKEKQSVMDGIYFKDASDMSELEDNSTHLIVTSPPYFAGKEYEEYVSFDEYSNMLNSVFTECYRVLHPSCRMCINIGDIPNLDGRKFSIARLVEPMCEDIGFIHKDTIVWKKDDPWQSNPHIKYQGLEGKYRILPSTENIFIFQKPGDNRTIPESIKLQTLITKEEWIKYVSGLWNIPSVRTNNNHPAKYPEEIPLRLIRMFSFVGDNILDPFLGSGTTVKVARQLERKGYGYELHGDKYKEVIMNTLSN